MDDKLPFDFPKVDFKVNIPPLKKLNFRAEVNKSQSSKGEMTEKQKQLVEQINSQIDESYYNWERSKDGYEFSLPESQFQLDNKMEIIDFQLPNMHEICEHKKLNSTQLSSIWEKAEFEVASSMANINHVWKLSPFLISGNKHRTDIFRKIVAAGLYLLCRIPRFFKKPTESEILSYYNLPLNIWAGFLSIISFFINVLDITVGTKSMIMNRNYNSALIEELEKRRCSGLKSLNFPETWIIEDYLQLFPMPDSQTHPNLTQEELKKLQKEVAAKNKVIQAQQQSIERVCALIENQWTDYHKQEVDNFEDVEEDEYNLLVKQVDSNKYDVTLKYFEKVNSLDSKLKQAFLNKIKAFKVIDIELHNYNSRLADQTATIVQSLKQKHPYLSRVGFWLDEQLAHQVEALKKIAIQEMQKKILDSIMALGDSENASLYRKSLELKQMLSDNVQTIGADLEKKLAQPDLTFQVYRRIYPPYEITSSGSGSTKRYWFTYYKTKEITSKQKCFRVWADLVRFGYWTVDLTYYAFRYALSGQFGLKGFVYWKTYYRDYSCNFETGEVKNDVDKVDPVIVKFRKVLEGIRNSRQDFEAAPDTGFFGKNMARIFNLLGCYLIRFTLVGVGFVLIIHPVLNILGLVICLTVSVTSCFWVMLLIVLRNLFRYLIYDFEALHYEYFHRLEGRVRGFFYNVKHPRSVFPIIQLLADALYRGFFRIFLVCALTVIFPIIAVLLFAIAVISFYLKWIWDFLVFHILITFFAKVPQRDTNIAKRIAGPGVSRNFFCNLSIDDAIILIQSLLEKIQLIKLTNQVTKIINTPFQFNLTAMENVLGQFIKNKSGLYVGLDTLNKTSSQLLQDLHSQTWTRQNQLPSLKANPEGFKIKFFDEELEMIKNICLQILKSNLKELKIDDYIWEHYSIARGKYKLLMCRILRDAFSSDTIFQSIEDADQQIVLKEDSKSLEKKAKIVSRIIEGEVNLTKFKPTFKPKLVQKAIYFSDVGLRSTVEYCTRPDCQRQEFSNLVFNQRVESEGSSQL